MSSKDFDELKKELEENGLIGFDEDSTSFLLAILTLLIVFLSILLIWKNQGII